MDGQFSTYKKAICIDGGGVRGLYVAKLIQKIEKEKGIYFKDYFDTFTGASTGAIIASLLYLGLTGEEIYEIYSYAIKCVFSNKKFSIPHYSIKTLKTVIDNILKSIYEKRGLPKGNKTLNILVFNKTNDVTEIFTLNNNRIENLSEIVTGSCAAPKYFRPYLFKHNGKTYELIDGSMITRSPSLLAYATTKQKNPTKDIKLLSIGTISNKNITSEFYSDNLFDVIKDVLYAGMEADIDYTDKCLKMIMGNKKYKRLELFSNKEQKLDEITVELQKIIEDIDNIYNSYFKKNVDEFMEG